MQISGNEHLTSIGVGQCSLVVGRAYKTPVHDHDGRISFILDNQHVT